MGNPGGGGLGGGFPAPGLPSTAQGQSTAGSTTTPQAGTAAPTQPFGLFNPFGLPPPVGGGAAGATPPAPGGGLFGDPALMQQMLGAFGPGAGLGGLPTTPADTRPPEERFQIQLQVRPAPVTPVFAHIFIPSNSKTWVSLMQRRTSGHFWPLAVTYILRSSTF